MNLQAYLDQLPHGGRAELAGKAEISAVYLWQIAKKKRLPSPEVAKAIEDATDGAVKRHELRPDIFDAPRKKAAG